MTRIEDIKESVRSLIKNPSKSLTEATAQAMALKEALFGLKANTKGVESLKQVSEMLGELVEESGFNAMDLGTPDESIDVLFNEVMDSKELAASDREEVFRAIGEVERKSSAASLGTMFSKSTKPKIVKTSKASGASGARKKMMRRFNPKLISV